MLFNSYEFIFVFLPITFFIYFYLNHKRLTGASKGLLVFSSLFFYSWWSIAYLPIILSSMLFNYILGNILAKNIKENKHKFSKKVILTFGVVANILLLGYFKYADFLIENINLVLHSNVGLLDLTLPLAISFFTFQQIAYLVDSYRQETKEYDFLNYAVFVTFFPQLIAGPIVHHKEMMPQFENIRSKIINYKNISMGLFIFSAGLFKKVIIADTFAVWATNGFDKVEVVTFIEAWATSLSYTFQLYFDFSGYTDMAIGLALLFNIKLPINFNGPYRATNIQDFWRRWHITLSRFLKDYIYIPLGGNKKGNFRTYNNLMATFILGGIWHGAGWTFVFWGFLHGFALVVHRIWSNLGFKLWTWVAWLITFNFVNLTWVFFRAKEWDDAIKVLKGMIGLSGFSISGLITFGGTLPPPFSYIIPSSKSINLFIILSTIFIILLINKEVLFKLKKYTLIYIVILLAMLIIPLMNLRRASEFLYFNF